MPGFGVGVGPTVAIDVANGAAVNPTVVGAMRGAMVDGEAEGVGVGVEVTMSVTVLVTGDIVKLNQAGLRAYNENMINMATIMRVKETMTMAPNALILQKAEILIT